MNLVNEVLGGEGICLARTGSTAANVYSRNGPGRDDDRRRASLPTAPSALVVADVKSWNIGNRARWCCGRGMSSRLHNSSLCPDVLARLSQRSRSADSGSLTRSGCGPMR